jgi:hypothetical protein
MSIREYAENYNQPERAPRGTLGPPETPETPLDNINLSFAENNKRLEEILRILERKVSRITFIKYAEPSPQSKEEPRPELIHALVSTLEQQESLLAVLSIIVNQAQL